MTNLVSGMDSPTLVLVHDEELKGTSTCAITFTSLPHRKSACTSLSYAQQAHLRQCDGTEFARLTVESHAVRSWGGRGKQ